MILITELNLFQAYQKLQKIMLGWHQTTITYSRYKQFSLTLTDELRILMKLT